jgi:hypothetical protein
MGMKNSLKLMAGIGLVMLAITGAGYGQENVKVVEGYRIDPPKASKQAKKVKSTEAVTVQGYPISVSDPASVAGYAATPAAAGAVTLEGFALPQEHWVTIRRTAKLYFDGESKASEVKIKMTDEHNYLTIGIQSSFWTGTLSIELIDPKGVNQGKFTLKTDDLVVTGDKTRVNEEVKGNMQKDFSNPMKGEWIVRAIPLSAKGHIEVSIVQQYRPGIETTATIEVIGVPWPEKKD